MKLIFKILLWLFISVIALSIILFSMIWGFEYYIMNKPESKLYGTWIMIPDENGYKETLTFRFDGAFFWDKTDDVPWTYDYIEPDSLMLYYHGSYERRFKILKITQDSMILKQSEHIVHVYDQGKEIEADYSGGEQPINTYTRSSHSSNWGLLTTY